MAPGRTYKAATIAGLLWLAAAVLDVSILAVSLRSPAGHQEAEGDGASARDAVPSDAFAEAGRAPAPAPRALLKAKAKDAKAPRDVTDWPASRREPPAGGVAGATGEAASRLAADAARLPMVVHKVRPGESLSVIDLSYMGSIARWKDIAEHNGIEPPYDLKTGQEIRLPMARAARTKARVALFAPRESDAELALRRIFARAVNPPPEGAFEPLDAELEPLHPLWEAYPWDVALAAAAALAVTLAVAVAAALAGYRGSMPPRAALRTLVWGAAGAGAAAALAGGLAVLAAGPMSRSIALELFFAPVVGAAAGGAGYLCIATGARGATRAGGELARAFGLASGLAVTAGLALAALTGAAASALASLRPW